MDNFPRHHTERDRDRDRDTQRERERDFDVLEEQNYIYTYSVYIESSRFCIVESRVVVKYLDRHARSKERTIFETRSFRSN